jgi:hypothetical protein
MDSHSFFRPLLHNFSSNRQDFLHGKNIFNTLKKAHFVAKSLDSAKKQAKELCEFGNFS